MGKGVAKVDVKGEIRSAVGEVESKVKALGKVELKDVKSKVNDVATEVVGRMDDAVIKIVGNEPEPTSSTTGDAPVTTDHHILVTAH